MRKTLRIAYYEARMSGRGWRFWLLLGLVGGISLFARRDYLIYAKLGNYLHTGYSFQHPSFWLMITILGLGAVALALDTCGRLRKTQMDRIMFPLPVGPMEIMWGRFLGVLTVVIPLCLIGVYSLGFWQYWYGHGLVVWQPFTVALCMLVLPIVVPIASLAITIRTFLKHDFASMITGLAVGAGLWVLGDRYELVVNVPVLLYQLENASPSLGVNFSFHAYWIQLSVHLLVSLFILFLAPLYLRRQEIQRWVVPRRKRIGLFGLGTLMRWVTNLRIDKQLGWKFRLGFFLAVLFFISGIFWALFLTRELRPVPLPEQFSESVVGGKLHAGVVDTLRYAIDIKPNLNYTLLDITATVSMKAKEDIRVLGFELDPQFLVKELVYKETTRSYQQTEEGLVTFFTHPIPAGEIFDITFSYAGRPKEFHPHYSRLNTVWYPLPWQKVKSKQNGRWIRMEGDLFDAEVRLSLREGQMGVFAGEPIGERNADWDRWETFYPVSALELVWGNYEYLEENRQGYRIRFYHLPDHQYQAQIFLEEVKEQEEHVRRQLGRLPFPQLTIIETPYHFDSQNSAVRKWLSRTQRNVVVRQREEPVSMPGVVHIPENELSYLHEKIWLLERLDHDPRTIPFYQKLRGVLYTIHQLFYRRLISVYFDHTLHPTGDYAFWMRDHLSGYASKLLEKNAWWRRRILNFDVGTRAELPLSVARRDSLLQMHRDGLYRDLESVRGEGLFRMIHHLLGDEKWWSLMQDVFRDYRFVDLPVETFMALAEKYYGGPLDWFEKDWLHGNCLPAYQITFAEATAFENINTMGIDYLVRVRVKNHGTGRIPVPIFIETERDYVFRNLWLGEGEEDTLEIEVPDRPVMAMVDPECWIVQEPYLDRAKRRREHSYQKIIIVGDEK
jgi:ABC-type transport system involved in multi-copper enzyme maturation permease subunit